MGQSSSRQHPYGYPPGYGQYGGGYGGSSYSNYGSYGGYGSMARDPYVSQRRKPRRAQTMPMYMPSMPMNPSPQMPYQPPPMYGYPGAYPQMIYPVVSPPINADQAAQLMKIGQNILAQGQGQQQMPQAQIYPSSGIVPQMQPPQSSAVPPMQPPPQTSVIPQMQPPHSSIIPSQMPATAPPAMSMPEPSVAPQFGASQAMPPSANPGMMMPEPVLPAGGLIARGMPTPRPSGEFANGAFGGPVIPVEPTPVIPQGMPQPAAPAMAMPEPPVVNNNNDPALAANPLPQPPQDLGVPAHLFTGTAFTHPTSTLRPTDGRPEDDDFPLANPLPPPIKDVFNSPRYRDLVVGSGYAEGDAYPEDWFEGRNGNGNRRHRHDREMSSLSRSISKLNPFRQRGHRRYQTMPVPYAGGNVAPGMMPEDSISSSESYSPSPVGNGGNGGFGSWFNRSRRRHDAPPPGFVAMPQPGIAEEGIAEEEQETGPPIEFDRHSRLYSGFTLTSPDTVLHQNKLYPSAMHLLEAHKFLGHRNDLAERVRKATEVAELRDVVSELSGFVRGDWEQVILNKIEEVLYRKFIQHTELRNLLLNTGISELVYRDDNDAFLGDGSGNGGNNLGKALMSVRERLRRDIAGRY